MAPHVIEWYNDYAGDDFEVIAVHYPEFSFERDIDNVRQAISDQNINYPVVLDNDRVAWAAYRQRFWPTLYLIDRAGNIRYKHIGEGGYDVTARYIEELMAEGS